MLSKAFLTGAVAIGWLVLMLLSCAGPGDSGSLVLGMLAPLVVLGSAIGLGWGIVERRRPARRPRFNTAGRGFVNSAPRLQRFQRRGVCCFETLGRRAAKDRLANPGLDVGILFRIQLTICFL